MKIIHPKIKQFISNQRIAPFETMLGFFFIYVGIFGIIYMAIGNTPTSVTTLGYKTTIVLNIAYSIAGLGMFIGIGLNKYNIEAFGLATIATSLFIRAFLTGWMVGIRSPLIVNIIVLNGIFVLSCITRLVNIIKFHKAKEVIIIAK